MLKQIDKRCLRCRVPLTDSNWRPEQKRNWINKCSECLNIEKRLYHQEWRKRHPGQSAIVSKRHKDKLRAIDPVKARAVAIYNDCRKRALKVGLPFDLTSAFVLGLMREAIVCPYFGWPLTHAAGKAKTLASLDRIDSGRGYTQDNVMVMSYLANLMKSYANEQELLAFANGILRKHATTEPSFEKVKGKA